MRKAVLIALSLLAFAAPAFAADPVARGVQGALDTFTQGCQKELATYCREVTPGEGRILACLYAFQDKLSARCEYALYDSAGQLDRMLSSISYVAAECRDDLKGVCSAVSPGEGRLLDCLVKNEAKISRRCATALKDVGYRK